MDLLVAVSLESPDWGGDGSLIDIKRYIGPICRRISFSIGVSAVVGYCATAQGEAGTSARYSGDSSCLDWGVIALTHTL